MKRAYICKDCGHTKGLHVPGKGLVACIEVHCHCRGFVPEDMPPTDDGMWQTTANEVGLYWHSEYDQDEWTTPEPVMIVAKNSGRFERLGSDIIYSSVEYPDFHVWLPIAANCIPGAPDHTPASLKQYNYRRLTDG